MLSERFESELIEYVNKCKHEVKLNVEHQEILKTEHNLLLMKMYEAESLLESYNKVGE